MKDYCPDEHYFDYFDFIYLALTRAKEALRKCRQRLNEQAREKNKSNLVVNNFLFFRFKIVCF
jgi:hypothetical protein